MLVASAVWGGAYVLIRAMDDFVTGPHHHRLEEPVLGTFTRSKVADEAERWLKSQ